MPIPLDDVVKRRLSNDDILKSFLNTLVDLQSDVCDAPRSAAADILDYFDRKGVWPKDWDSSYRGEAKG